MDVGKGKVSAAQPNSRLARPDGANGMSIHKTGALLEALEMALEAINGEQGEQELKITKAVLALRIVMLRGEIQQAKIEERRAA